MYFCVVYTGHFTVHLFANAYICTYQVFVRIYACVSAPANNLRIYVSRIRTVLECYVGIQLLCNVMILILTGLVTSHRLLLRPPVSQLQTYIHYVNTQSN